MNENKSLENRSLDDSIKGSTCSCGINSIPPEDFCLKCGQIPETVVIKPEGEILTFTLVHVTASGFKPPLGIAIVELDDKFIIMCNTRSECQYNIGEKVGLEIIDDKFYIKE